MESMKDHQLGSNSDSYYLTPSHSPAPAPAYDGDEDLEMQQIELEERLNLCNKKVLYTARSSRPENTKKAYIPR